MDTKELGNLGERLACEYLVNKGFKILGKNYRISFGEIDIIAKKKWSLFSRSNKIIHFVEVKTLKKLTFQSVYPEEHVDYKKQRKLKQMAQIWLEKNKFPQDYSHQIDVIGILIDPTTTSLSADKWCGDKQNIKKAKLHYFPNVVEDLTS